MTPVLSNNTDTLDFDYETVVVKGSNLSNFISVNTDQLFVYKYTAASGTWTQIPFQFDDVEANENYFSENDGFVDAADVQRLCDCGHQTNRGEFNAGTETRFFSYNENTDDQIIDAADLQVFGDCWHNEGES